MVQMDCPKIILSFVYQLAGINTSVTTLKTSLVEVTELLCTLIESRLLLNEVNVLLCYDLTVGLRARFSSSGPRSRKK